VFVKTLNKKLPKREKENIDDITSLVDLDSFRMEETFKGKISLEEKDGEFDPLSLGSNKTFVEDEKDTLSEIIKKINEIYGETITEEDKIDLENMRKRVMTNEELNKVMTGDNSETNKRHKFNEVLTSIVLSYVNNRLDFYNKIEDPKVKTDIGDLLYNELMKQNNQMRL
jgi:type I restriction enzyme R subunit